MGRWVVAAGCLLALAACGTRTDGHGGTSGLQGAPPEAPDSGPGTGGGGATDGGTLACSASANLIANTGGGSMCGIKPVLGQPRTVTTPLLPNDSHPGTEQCVGTNPTDGSGDLLVTTFSAEPFDHVLMTSYDASGAQLGKQGMGPLGGFGTFPVRSGWLLENATGGSIVGGGGAVVRPFPADLDGGTQSFGGGNPVHFARAPGGGAVGVFSVPSSDPACHTGVFGGGLVLQGYDAISGQPTGPARSIGCADVTTGGNVAVAENLAGDVLAFAYGSGWHLAPDGTLTPLPAPFQPFDVLPLIDGRFVLRQQTGGTPQPVARQWAATIDNDGTVSPPPCWLATRLDVDRFQIVLGGQAYLAFKEVPDGVRGVDCSTYAEVILPDGTTCGFVPVTGTALCSPETVQVGLDGTLTSIDLNFCTTSWWPEAFR